MKQVITFFLAIILNFAVYKHSISMENGDCLSQLEIISKIIDSRKSSLSGASPLAVNNIIQFWRVGEAINSPINIVMSSFFDKTELANSAISYIKEEGEKLGGLLEWWVFSETTPKNMNKLLENSGFEQSYSLKVMIYYLNNELIDVHDDKHISVYPLGVELIRDWIDILKRAYNFNGCFDEDLYQDYIKRGINSGVTEYYSGYYLGELAATAGLFKGNDYGFIYTTATDEKFRRKKLATQIIQVLLNRAKELGLKYVILECDESIVELYKKIGFEEAFCIERFHLKS